MTIISLTTDELQKRIEDHFKSQGLKAELWMASLGQSGGITHHIKFEGIFNSSHILEFGIYFNKKNEPVITNFKGICPIGELTKILNELETVLKNIL